MPSRRTYLLLGLLLLMELLAGFVLLLGTGLLGATSWSFGLFWLLVVAAAGGAVLGSFASTQPWSERRSRASAIVVGAIVIGIPTGLAATSPFMFLPSCVPPAVAFWRGLRVAADSGRADGAHQRFAVGLGMLSFGLLWAVAAGRMDEPQLAPLLAVSGVAFLLVSLLALATAQIPAASESAADGAIALAVLGHLGAVLLFSVLCLQFFALDLGSGVIRAVGPFFDALGRDASALLALLAGPVDRLVGLFGLHLGTGLSLPHPTPPARQPYGRPHSSRIPIPATLLGLATLLATAALAAAAGFVVWHVIPRARPRPVEMLPYSEERHSQLSLSAVWRRLLASVRRWLRDRTGTPATVLFAVRQRVRPLTYPSDPIRRTYVELLRRAGSLGIEMSPASTPLEFREQLTARWPEGGDEFETVTWAYVRRRYGESAPAEHELSALRADWQRLRRIMRAPSALAAGLEKGRALLSIDLASPQHQPPSRPYPRADGPPRWTGADRTPWRPTGVPLILLICSFAALVLIAFLVILTIASGRLV